MQVTWGIWLAQLVEHRESSSQGRELEPHALGIEITVKKKKADATTFEPDAFNLFPESTSPPLS